MRQTALVRPLALAAVPVLAAALVAACSEAGPSTGTVEYHAQVRPLLEAHCGSCHHDGGPAPFSIAYHEEDWRDGAPDWAGSAVSAVEDGRMPPWLPAEGCKDLAFSRVLSDEEKALLFAWRDEGFPVGDAAEYQPPAAGEAPPNLGDPTLVIDSPAAYTPRTDRTDDYRCFLLPTELTEETYLIASTVAPGEPAIVHHALIYLIEPGGISEIEEEDAEDEAPGYECFGGPGGGALTTLGAWVPGSVLQRTPAGSAFVLPAGSRLVVQLHYNTLALNGADPPADLSTVHLWTTKEKPESRIDMLPMAHLGMVVPAGEEASVEERLFEVPVDADIVGVAPHMHLLGESIDVALEPQGGDEVCLIDIPRWDFHWQQSYPFPSDGYVPAKKGDKLRVRCTYDNSAANQPIVNGEKQAPRDVTWGEGTLDEMCLVYMMTKVPYDAPDFRCGAYPECITQCPEGDGHCFFDCATLGGGQCAGCIVESVFGCAPQYCVSTGLALQGCTKECGEVGPACLLHQCGAEFDEFYACLEPHLENGDCAEQMAVCGL